jgi:poly-gamma-glutamate synthesis protein (capsule biosynthesis protein)
MYDYDGKYYGSASFRRDGSSYLFDPLYEFIKPYIDPADIAFVNQETILGAPGTEYAGYPRFNTPQAAGEALVRAGFDVVNQATNHILDRGEEGVRETIAYWQGRPDVSYTGIFSSEKERDTRLVLIKKNDFTIGFLAYTTGTNAIPLPKGKHYLVSLADRDLMKKDIEAIRPQCDYLIVSMHWGDEYSRLPSQEQAGLAEFLAQNNVDLIVGHHPHVMQPLAVLPRPDGGQTLCAYSLGNFISAHANPKKEALVGGLLYVKLFKSESLPYVAEYGVIPLITHYTAKRNAFSVYPLADYGEKGFSQHGKTDDPNFTYTAILDYSSALFGSALMLKNPFLPE